MNKESWIDGEFVFTNGGAYCLYKGDKYRRDKDNHYQRSPITFRGKDTMLHRVVYSEHFGAIPKGLVVHHIDGNPQNNHIENLEAITVREHHLRHHNQTVRLLMERQDKMHKWQKTEEGLRWYREVHYPATKDKLHKIEKHVCVVCGKEFLAEHNAMYCSDACKSKAARMNENYYEMANCEVCGKPFRRFKYGSANRPKKRCCSLVCSAKLADATIGKKIGDVRCVVCGHPIRITCGKKVAICCKTCYTRWSRHQDQYPSPWINGTDSNDKRRFRYHKIGQTPLTGDSHL